MTQDLLNSICHSRPTKCQLLKFIGLIMLISFPLHFVWEWLQCAPFFYHRATPALPLSMVKASIGDVLLTFLVIFLAGCLTYSKRKLFFEKFDGKTFIFIEVIALFVAVETEKIGLTSGRWSYTDINPLVPLLKVSALPVLQMMFLIPSTLFLTIKILNKLQISEQVK